MGKRGPSPQPVAVLKAKGTINVTRANDQIADANELDWIYNEIPTPPDDLTEKAKNIWNQQLLQSRKIYGYISFIDFQCLKNTAMFTVKWNILKGTYQRQNIHG
jgi:hypothetical protein